MGDAAVRPGWSRTDATLVQAEWTRTFHEAVAGFVPSPGARMRARAAQIRRYGADGEGLYGRLLRGGVADDLGEAVRELDGFPR
ncbi:hypothetical protein [Nonomuraea rubra]|uniref:hypothetical protein n=1 Tax=Nonomuraea rubra TaxID=46180 RepID=UPI0033C3EA71